MFFILTCLIFVVSLSLNFVLFVFQGAICILSDYNELYLCFKVMVEMRRIELLTPCLQGRCSPR